ncbi:Gfo/Idh/MocA family oxidoreductase [bacterium]|nr:Gfo/Idh/MocA family oxidoreductase [bacterium]
MSSPLRCGIIGCGVIGPAHAESYQRISGVQVAWACDLVESKARAMAAKFNIPHVTTRCEEVLADETVDCISVCTDHASHSPITVAALKAGKHVLCEKALAQNTAALDKMFAAHAHHPHLVFSGVFQHRFDEAFRYMKRLVDAKAFGDILTACVQVRCLRTHEYYQADEWRGTWAKEGGAVLINQAIHFIDALLWIMGGAEAVCGTHANITHNGVMETEDTATAVVRFASGALGTIEATCSSNIGWEYTLSIHGSLGSVDLRNAKLMKVSFSDSAREAEVATRLASITEERTLNAAKSYYGSGHPAQIADFVAAIREGRAPFVPAHSARHTVDTVLAVYESHRKGTWVKLT